MRLPRDHSSPTGKGAPPPSEGKIELSVAIGAALLPQYVPPSADLLLRKERERLGGNPA